MNIHYAAPLYIAFLIMLGLAMAQARDVIKPKTIVVERCAVTMYYSGNRVVYVGKGEVWK
jgi:hypothetical protein